MDPACTRSNFNLSICSVEGSFTSEYRAIEVSPSAVEEEHTVVREVQGSRNDSAASRRSQPCIRLVRCNTNSQVTIFLRAYDIL